MMTPGSTSPGAFSERKSESGPLLYIPGKYQIQGIEDARATPDVQTRNLGTAVSALIQIETECDQTKRQMRRDYNQQIRTLEAEFKDLTGQLQTVTQQLRICREGTTECKGLTEEITRLNNELRNANRLKDECSNALRASEVRIDQLNREASGLQKNLTDMKASLDRVQDELKSAVARARSGDGENASLRAEISELTKKQQKLATNFTKSEAEVERLKNRLDYLIPAVPENARSIFTVPFTRESLLERDHLYSALYNLAWRTLDSTFKLDVDSPMTPDRLMQDLFPEEKELTARLREIEQDLTTEAIPKVLTELRRQKDRFTLYLSQYTRLRRELVEMITTIKRAYGRSSTSYALTHVYLY
jgi:chromosome segregation ATPase